MTNTGSMLDAYFIAQALGWEWNIWTMIIITLGIPLLFIGIGLIVFLIWTFGIYMEWW